MDPLINGQYPKTMQDIVKDRLPSFTPEQAKLVKGSSDCFGINQYTTYYISDQQTPQQGTPSYSSDWGVQYNCEFTNLLSDSLCVIVTTVSEDLIIVFHPVNFAVERNGQPIGQLV
jgi:beta-glucosidase/6-phospho-beta-glucosidase/beta-galactosidase